MVKKKKSKKKGLPNVRSVPADAILPNSSSVSVKKNVVGEEKPKYSVDDLLEKVDQYLECFEYDLAKKFCEKALQLEPKNTKVIETFGNVCAESGDVENAKDFYKNAVKVEPNSGYVKYLYLGQLSEGIEAAEYYLSAIKMIKSELNNEENSSSDDRFRIQLSNIYCSLAELYMTDCCMEEDAQNLCKQYCELAIESYDGNIDAYLATCNYHLSCNDMDNAKICLGKGFNIWKSVTEAESDNIPNLVSYESRITLVKILIELEQYDNVSHVIDQLIEENEDDIRIWYYLGLSKHFLFEKDTNLENPRFYLEKALELFEKTDCEDEEMKEHILEMLKSCPLEDMETIDEENDSDVDSEKEDDCMET